MGIIIVSVLAAQTAQLTQAELDRQIKGPGAVVCYVDNTCHAPDFTSAPETSRLVPDTKVTSHDID